MLLFIGLFSSCEQNALEEDIITVNAVEKLIALADNEVLELTEDLPPIKFEWRKAEVSKGITPKYEVIFFEENGTSVEPIFKLEVETNNVEINQTKLNEIAAKAEIEVGESGVVQWVVRAYHESFSS